VIDRSIHGHAVAKLYFFDTDGWIVFSTQEDHIGFQVGEENNHFRKAAGGAVSWVMKRRYDPLDMTGDPTAEELLETYVPIYSRFGDDPDKVVGVIEIYQKVEELQRELAKSTRRIVTVALVSVGALFLVCTYFIVRADRIIRQRRRELVMSNEALRDLSRDLEMLVGKRTQQLVEKAKLASLGGLAAGVAHEINTPLATISACAEGSAARLRELIGINSEREKEVFEYLDFIGAEAFRCKEITRSLLDYSRQNLIDERSEFDINELISQTLVLFRLNKENRSIEIEAELEEGLRTVSGDPAQIRQVVYNLVENALHGVRGVESPRVILRTRSEEGHVVVECQDNGSGIPTEITSKIFEPFFTTKPSGQGIGLGLALSFNIIQRHGGVLDLASSRIVSSESSDSTDGPGTLFRFTLKFYSRADSKVTEDTRAP
jgi:signal transduction histidine kinase